MSIAIIGSINIDLVVETDKPVSQGETILAKKRHYFPGGKGANQALACARIGGDATFIGKVGDDDNADVALSYLTSSNLKLDVDRLPGADTGMAIVMLDGKGNNSIVVSQGANTVWTETDEDIERHLNDIEMLVVQLETPVPIVKRFLQISKRKGIKTVLNPSPVTPEISDLLPFVDILVMNESEAEYIAGQRVQCTEDFQEKIKLLGVGEVIVTLGSKGSFVFQSNDITHIQAYKTNVVDTTAAGDTFTGALVSRLYQKDDFLTAADYASCAAAIAVSRIGAQSSIPTAEEVAEAMATEHNKLTN